MAEGEAGKKRARIDGTDRRAAPVSPFVATPPSQHLAKILRVRHPCVRHGDDYSSFARSRARAEPSEAPSSLESDRTRDSDFAGPSSPADAGLRTPSAPLLARRARALSVVSLSVCRVEQLETDASGCSTDSTIGDRRAERREDERRVREKVSAFRDETKQTESARAAETNENTEGAFSNDEPCAYAYVPGTRMPSTGWMQRCFGCGTWTGQAVRLGAFEVFRCNACARQFRRRADELKAAHMRSGDATFGTRDDAADARKHRGGCHRRAASAESNELTGLASRLREFLLARCPDAGLEHSIANHTA
jgi:hypothetical protein